MVTSARRIRNLGALLLGAALIVGLGGCEGDDGDDGATGPAGPPGPAAPGTVTASVPEELQASITGVTISSPPVVEFTLADQDGFPFIASSETGELESSFASFTMAKLVPGVDGETNRWQSYVQRDDLPGGEVVLQAATDGGGTLVNNGDGTYTYTFETDVTAVPEVPFEPNLTHRVGMEIRGDFRGEELPGVNATFDFVPAGGPVTETKDIVSTETCNSCHGRLSIHGGGRFDVEHCVTCHNPGSTDEQTGNTIDFRVMIHQIHRGANLPSVVAGNPLQFGGFGSDNFGAPLLDFSEVVFPQDVRNCTTCHDPANPETPDAVNFKDAPTIAACGSCHDDVDFVETGDGHPAGVQPDSACTTCHSDTGFIASIPESHTIPTKVAAGRFQYNILSVTNTAPGETPVIRFSVTDPTNNDAPYDIFNDTPFIQGGGATRLALTIAYSTTDYTNRPGGGGGASSPLSLNPIGNAAVSGDELAVALGDGVFEITSTEPIPLGVTGSGAVGFEGHPAEDLDGDPTTPVDRIPVTGAVEFFAITDAEPQPRRDVVELAKCQTCHGVNDGLALHGANRTDSIQLCVLCHNPNNTDIVRRPEDPDGMLNGVNTATPDGLEEQTIDFKAMIHGLHGAEVRQTPFVAFGFGGPLSSEEILFPRSPADCQACHAAGTYEPPLPASVLATTVVTGPLLSDPSDDANVSATAAVCSSCHDGTTAQAHMEDNGAVFGTFDDGGASTQEVLSGQVESCAVCHRDGAIAGVAEVHGLR